MKASLALCVLVALAGCNQEEFSRYPSLSVPEFRAEQYLRALSDANPEIVYNAVCNLGDSADNFSRTLSADSPDRQSAEYRTAQAVYEQIVGLLQHREPQVVAVSLRFLQLFAADYKPKAELIEPVSRVQSEHPLVQFEQLTTLRAIAPSPLPANLVRRWLSSPSWIVSRSAYSFAGESLRAELHRRYRSTTDETEKLLLLAGLTRQPGPAEIELLQQESIAAGSAKIRRCALGALLENLESPGVAAWFGDRYAELEPEEQGLLFQGAAGAGNETGLELACRLLSAGHDPGAEFLKSVSRHLEENPDDAAVMRIAEAVRASPVLAERWRVVRERAEQERARFAALSGEYKPLAREFTEKAKALLAKYDVPVEAQERLLKPVGDLSPVRDR